MEKLGIMTVSSKTKKEDLLQEFIADPMIDYQRDLHRVLIHSEVNLGLSSALLDDLVDCISDIVDKRLWRRIVAEPAGDIPAYELPKDKPSDAISDDESPAESENSQGSEEIVPELTKPLSTKEILHKIHELLLDEIESNDTPSEEEEEEELSSFLLHLTVSLILLLLEKGAADDCLEICLAHLRNEDSLSIPATKHAAIMFKKIGDWKQSLGMFQRLLALTADPIVHCKIGDIYYAQQSFKKAFHHYKTAVELNPRTEYANSRLENARKFYVARLVRKRLKIEKFRDLPEDYELPISQGDWVHPPPSPALIEFFERWKTEGSSAVPVKLAEQQNFQSVDSILARKKKKKNHTRKMSTKDTLEGDIELIVPVEKFKFVEVTDELSSMSVRVSTAEEHSFRYISSNDPADDIKSCSAICCGQRVSLYPWLPGHSSREGGPVTDCFGISYFSNIAIVALADGSSWGRTASQAASKAVNGFITEMEENRLKIDDTIKVSKILLNGIAAAHNNILYSKSGSLPEMGTSTLLGGLLLPLKDKPGKWSFICASVGDCKAFHLSMKTHRVKEITIGNDRFKDNRDDPGGAIGAIDVSQIDPDLRNLRLFSHPCDDGDIIILVSDGIHDNFNPKYLGIAPRELKLDNDDWNDVGEADGHRAVSPFVQHSIENKIHQSGIVPTSHRCTHALLNNAMETTQKSRNFMEQNPTKKLPDNYSLFPGQLDYASCLSFSVGVYSKRHASSVNLWDYHLGVEESYAKGKLEKCSHPSSENTPISIVVGESSEGVVIVCRTILGSFLRCVADETQVYLKLYRKGSSILKMANSSTEYSPVDNSIDLERPSERTVHLPVPIEPSSQQISEDNDSGLIIIRFSHKKPN